MEIPMTAPVPLSESGRGAYSPLLQAGPFIFLSGQLPLDPSSGLITGEDIESQTRQVIANVDRLLRSANASVADIVSVTAYLRDISDWDSFNAAYRSLMPSPFPTRTTVGVQLHGALLELTVIACTGRHFEAPVPK
jgi:2-iminobutanoate/2-iminopropanoate deaminase